MASDEPGETADKQLSRRDFLRRAGKEAADTGTRLIPGAALAKTVLGVGEKPETPEGEDPSAAPHPNVPRWLRAVSEWRGKQRHKPEPKEDA